MVKGPDDKYTGVVSSINDGFAEIKLSDVYRFRFSGREEHYKLTGLSSRTSNVKNCRVGLSVSFSRRWLSGYVGRNFKALNERGYILNGRVGKVLEDIDDSLRARLENASVDDDGAPSPFELEPTT